MKIRKIFVSFIIAACLILNLSIYIPNISAPPPPTPPDQFIGEIFPNCTLPLHLLYSSTIIIFNATNFPNNIDIQFDANYTIYNSDNTTTIPINIPLSLETDITQFSVEVYLNETQIPYDFFSTSNWNENITVSDVQLRIIGKYPITLIRSNVTILKNSSSVIRYHLSGTMNDIFESSDTFKIVYSVGTLKEWIGNTTGRAKLRAYGTQPLFSIIESYLEGYFIQYNISYSIIDINGMRMFLCEWNNIKNPFLDIIVSYYGEEIPYIIFLIVSNGSIYIAIVVIIILVIIIRKNRKKLESR
ncbi:MAG: hypothetical protein ACFFG0_22075 [Candidatus Thorarchaeota archaeon]